MLIIKENLMLEKIEEIIRIKKQFQDSINQLEAIGGEMKSHSGMEEQVMELQKCIAEFDEIEIALNLMIRIGYETVRRYKRCEMRIVEKYESEICEICRTELCIGHNTVRIHPNLEQYVTIMIED